jgi:hypothetical protein
MGATCVGVRTVLPDSRNLNRHPACSLITRSADRSLRGSIVLAAGPFQRKRMSWTEYHRELASNLVMVSTWPLAHYRMRKHNLTPAVFQPYWGLTCMSSANVLCRLGTHFPTLSNHRGEIAVVRHTPCSKPCKMKLARDLRLRINKIRDKYVSPTPACLINR